MEVQLALSSLESPGALLVWQKCPETSSCPETLLHQLLYWHRQGAVLVSVNAARPSIHGEQTRTILYGWKRVMFVSCSTTLL